MPRENVEIARKALEAFNRRDRDAWLPLMDPEVEWRSPPEWPESGTVRGREAVWDFMVSIDDAWEQENFEMVAVIDAGDTLVARYQRAVRGKASGIADEFDYWWVGTFRGGRVLSHEWFATRDAALEAAGLSE